MKNLKCIMVLLIAVAMIFSMIPSTSFAWADTENPTGTGDESSSVFDVSGENETQEVVDNGGPTVADNRGAADDISGFTVELWRGADPDSTSRPVPDEYGNYVWTPESAGAGHKFTYRVTFQINAGSSRVYNPGEIKISVPTSILKHMVLDENDGVTGERVLDTGETFSTILEPYDSSTQTFGYYLSDDGKQFIVSNSKPTSTSSSSQVFSFDISYVTTHPTFDYMDYDHTNLTSCASDTVPAILYVDDEPQLNATGPAVYIDTSAKLIEDKNLQSSDIYNHNTDGQGNYVSQMGSRKIVDERYGENGNYYMRFLIILTLQQPVTQRYSIDITDTITDLSNSGFEPIGYYFNDDRTPPGTDQYIPITSYVTANNTKTFGNLKVDNLTSNMVYCYILTKVPIPSGNFGTIKLSNKETTTVSPACGVDDDDVRTCNWGPWSMSFHITEPTGSYMIYKFGNDNWQTQAHKDLFRKSASESFPKYEYASYMLEEFKAGEMEKLSGFGYWIHWYGTGFKHTTGTGTYRTSSNEGVPADQYGKYDLRWELTDNEVQLEGQKLNPEDYCVDRLTVFFPASHDRVWSSENNKWVMGESIDFSNDKPWLVYGQFNGDSEWQQIAELQFNGYRSASAEHPNVHPYTDPEVISQDESKVEVANGLSTSGTYIDPDDNVLYETGSQTPGFVIKFKDGVHCTGYKIVNENSHYQHYGETEVDLSLYNTSHVQSLIAGKMDINVKNISDMTVYKWDVANNKYYDYPAFRFSGATAAERQAGITIDGASSGDQVDRMATDRATGTMRSLEQYKYFLEGTNLIGPQSYKAKWLITAREYSTGGERSGFHFDAGYVQQQSGTFYEVLPRGTQVDLDSLKVYNGAAYSPSSFSKIEDKLNAVTATNTVAGLIPKNYYSTETYQDPDTGLTVLKIVINQKSLSRTAYVSYSANGLNYSATMYMGYSLAFDTYTPWGSLEDYGFQLTNVSAYETGNDDFIRVNAYPDNPANSAVIRDNLTVEDSQYDIGTSYKDKIVSTLTDLDPDSNDNRFCYAYAQTTTNLEEYSESGVKKFVRAENEGLFSEHTTIGKSGKYIYKLNYTAPGNREISNLVLYDHLEGNDREEENPEWKGKLLDIDLTEIIVRCNEMGIEPPKVYISTQEIDMSSYDVDNMPNLNDTSVWTMVQDDTDLSTARSLAVDFGEYVLSPGQSVNVFLTMEGPDRNDSENKITSTWNNVFASGTQGDSQAFYVQGNNTQVDLHITGYLAIRKWNDRNQQMRGVTFTLTGTDISGDPVELQGETGTYTDAAGTTYLNFLLFSDLEISGENGYTLTEIVPDGFLSEPSTWNVVVNPDGTVTVTGDNIYPYQASNPIDGVDVYYHIYNHKLLRGRIEIPVSKEFSGREWNGTDEFHFELTPVSGAPLRIEETDTSGNVSLVDKTKLEVTINKDTPNFMAAFDEMVFTQDDMSHNSNGSVIFNTNKYYVYRITEVASEDENGITYSRATVYARVTLRADSRDYDTADGTNGITATVRFYSNSACTIPLDEASFVNTYEARGEKEIPVVKVLSNLDGDPFEWGDDYKFVFDIEASENADDTVTGTDYEFTVKTADKVPDPAEVTILKTTTDHKAVFGKLTFTMDDLAYQAGDVTKYAKTRTFLFTVYENLSKSTDEDFIEYDSTPREVSVTITDNEKGTIVVTAQSLKEGQTAAETVTDDSPITFTNVVKDTDLKILKYTLDENGEEKVLANAEFTLTWEDAEGTAQTLTVTTGADGIAVFEHLLDGSYTLEETKSPEGYLDQDYTWSVEINGGEVTVKQGSSSLVEGVDYTYENRVITLKIRNTEKTQLSVVKAWKNADGSTTAPDGGKVTFTLYADGSATEYTVELDGTPDDAITTTGGYESEAWKATFVNLPKYKIVNGKAVKIKYTVTETGKWPGYVVTYGTGMQETVQTSVSDGGTITNTETPTQLAVIKAWKNADGTTTPPDGASVIFTLYADSAETDYKVVLDGNVDTVVPEGAGGYEPEAWTAAFVNLPKYKAVNGEAVEIVYTVVETGTWPGYVVSYGDGTTEEFAVNGGTITNTQTPTGLSVIKAWNNADGSTTAPENAEVIFTLWADGAATNYTVTLDGTPETTAPAVGGYESEAWKATFVNLPKQKIVDGQPQDIEYTVVESGTWPGYTVSYGDGTTVEYAVDGGTITNTQEVTTLKVTKAWKNTDGTTTAPDGGKVTFTLYADGDATELTLELDGARDMILPIPGRTSAIETESWVATFFNVPKYKIENGAAVEIEYTVVESGTWPGYTVSYEGGENVTYAVDNGKITNTQDKTELSVIKAWKNADGSTTAPDGAEVIFTLFADGAETDYAVTLDGNADTTAPTVTGGYESEAWKATFVNLPKYKLENGEKVEIQYTVKETGSWAGYEVIYEGEDAVFAIADGVITNIQKVIGLTVTKAWQNADGSTTAPDGAKVTFTLYADGSATEYTVELDGTPETTEPEVTGGYESEAWKAKFVNLPKFKEVEGKEVEIEYTVVESGTWPGYTVSYEGGENVTYAVDNGVITNTQEPTELSVTKAWKNADGTTTPPEDAEVTFTLCADGAATNYTVTLDGEADTTMPNVTGGYESDSWKATFVKLPKYKIENGAAVEIEYTIQETGTWPGYAVSYGDGTTAEYAVDGGTITNEQITTEIGGTKTWNDDEFFVDEVPVDGYQRPESITVDLLADGTVIDSKTVTEEDDWEYEFTDLPKYRIENGTAVEIVYTVEEETVGGYSTVIDGTDISNTPMKAERVTPTQIWLVKVDALTYTEPEPEDPIEPDEPEENVSPLMRSESGGDTFTGLEGAEFTLTDPNGNESKIYTNENGEARILFETEGTYKLQETAAPSGYQNPGTVYTIEVEKVFTNVALVDDENAPGGKVWMWYYQLEADVDADYNAETGILTVQDPPELTEISGEKIWDDENDADKIRPKSIVVELYANGEKVDEQTVTAASNWKFTFTDLPKVKDGEEIVYTIGEVKVEGYTTKIDGFKITNTHKVVKTGDEMNLGLWIGMLIMALAAMGILGVRRLIKKR